MRLMMPQKESWESLNINLRIKKIYFDQILSGEKTSEYRRDDPYFQKMLFKKHYKTITFHYQIEKRLQCDILQIKKIKNPLLKQKLPFLMTKMVFEIRLKNPRLL